MLRRFSGVLTVRLTLRGIITAVRVWVGSGGGLFAVRLLLISVVRTVRLLRLTVAGIKALSGSLRLSVLRIVALSGSLRLTVLRIVALSGSLGLTVAGIIALSRSLRLSVAGIIALSGSLRLTVAGIKALSGSLRLTVLRFKALRRRLRLIISGLAGLYRLLRIILTFCLSENGRQVALLRSRRLIGVGRLLVRLLIRSAVKAVLRQCVLYGRLYDGDLIILIRRLSGCLGRAVYRSVLILGVIVLFGKKLIHNCLFLRFITCGCFYIFAVFIRFVPVRRLVLFGTRQTEGKAGIFIYSGVDEDIASVQTHYCLGYEQT